MIFNCPIHPFPLQYLGLPLSPSNLRRVDYLPLIENIDNRLAGWKCTSLSRGGRLILLNSVLSSLPTYFCSAFTLPAWVIKAIDRVRRGFLWKGKNKTSGFHCLANWNQVCRPKSVGGLGITNLQVANLSLLMKGLWKFYSSPSLPWVNLLKQKHYRRRSAATSIHAPKVCCPIWRGIFKLMPPFLTSVDFVLQDGFETPFWTGRWCGQSPLRNRFPILYDASTNTRSSVITWTRRFASRQNLGFSPPHSPQEQFELQQLSLLLNNLTLSPGSGDSISWRWSGDGRFSVKSASDFLLFDGLNKCTLPFLWKLKIPLRVKIFIWLAKKNKVLTSDNLMKRGWFGPSICTLCNLEAESLEHILFSCSFTFSVWNCLMSTLRLPSHYSLIWTSTSDVGLAARWRRMRRAASEENRSNIDLAVAAYCWELWTERNRRIFENRQARFDIMGRSILETFCFWKSELGNAAA